MVGRIFVGLVRRSSAADREPSWTRSWSVTSWTPAERDGRGRVRRGVPLEMAGMGDRNSNT